jgi:hypothetical protein
MEKHFLIQHNYLLKNHIHIILFQINIHFIYQKMDLFIECNLTNSEFKILNYLKISVPNFDISDPIFNLYNSSHSIIYIFFTSFSFY